VDPRATAWCGVCCARHEQGRPCPGELLATGPERHAFRITVDTPYGSEAFGVLVAPCGTLWRARILTYPRALWTIPGGRGAMKFVAERPREAERQAVDFLERFCDERGYRKCEASVPPRAGPVDPEQAPDARAGGVPSSVRKLLATPVRFGHSRATQEATTANVSQRGMFVATSEPFEPGAPVRLRVTLDSFVVPLRGVVVWCRRHVEPGRPAGMGIRIFQPSSLYVNYIGGLS
jgi:hypothetical protein